MFRAPIPPSEAGAPSLGEVLDRMGLGWAQGRSALLGGSVWMADGSELLLVGTATRAVSQEWGLNAGQRGALVSAVFVGIFLGNIISGPVGDRLGRRLPIISSYISIAVFSILSSTTQSYCQLLLVRVMVGASFGLGQPAATALVSEVSPSWARILVGSLTGMLFTFGELYSAALVWWDDPDMKDLHWRWLLATGCLPSVVGAFLALFFLHESPLWLAAQGRDKEARNILDSMRADNRAHEVSIDFEKVEPRNSPDVPPMRAMAEPVAYIYSRRMLYSTLAMIYSCFALNVLFYGTMYAFSQILGDVSAGPSGAVMLLAGAFWELPGSLLAAAFGMLLPRKPVMGIYCVVTALGLVLFAAGAGGSRGGGGTWLDRALLHGGFVGIKVFVCVGFTVIYQYSTEIYPTYARTTGNAACKAGGRVGGMLAPLAYEWLAHATGGFETFFHLIAASVVVDLVLILFLPFETFRQQLDAGDDRSGPSGSSDSEGSRSGPSSREGS